MTTLADRRLGATEYADLVARVRDTVAATVPPGSSVLVVSKGDSALLDHPGLSAAHFPQDAAGGYAGHHPHDGAAAREELEALRRAGAEYLVIPATARWWLEFYGELARHLTEHGALLADVPGACMVYGLGGRAEAAPVLPAAEPPEASAEQIREFLASLLHESSELVVLEPRDGFAAALAPLRASPLHVPAEPAPELLRAALDARAGAGAGYLVLPLCSARWLRRHGWVEAELEESLPTVADQRHLCRVFEINRPLEVA